MIDVNVDVKEGDAYQGDDNGQGDKEAVKTNSFDNNVSDDIPTASQTTSQSAPKRSDAQPFAPD